ncbi:MAG: hypothetical protein ACRDD8_15950 [Bacteroidales bacterium]
MKKTLRSLGILAVATMMMTGCGAKKEIVDVRPNEVAYEVNNIANDKTQKFDGTREDWSKIKSSSKMLIVSKTRESVGPLGWTKIVHVRVIPEKKVVVVSQNIVAKEWVGEVHKGSNKKDDSFRAGSSNGAEFTVGITTSAKISDTDKYLSTYGINPNSKIHEVRVDAIPLDLIMETTIKPYISGELSAEFGKLETGVVQPKKNDVIAEVARKTKERFALDGIDILTFNLSGDVNWVDENIQNSINQTARLLADKERVEAQQKVDATQAETKRLVAEQETKRKAAEITILAKANADKAEQERKEAETRNKMAFEKAENNRKIAVEQAKAEREIANEKAKVVSIEKELVQLKSESNKADAILLSAQADFERAKKWNGKLQYSEVTIQGASSIVDKEGKVQTMNIIK